MSLNVPFDMREYTDGIRASTVDIARRLGIAHNDFMVLLRRRRSEFEALSQARFVETHGEWEDGFFLTEHQSYLALMVAPASEIVVECRIALTNAFYWACHDEKEEVSSNASPALVKQVAAQALRIAELEHSDETKDKRIKEYEQWENRPDSMVIIRDVSEMVDEAPNMYLTVVGYAKRIGIEISTPPASRFGAMVTDYCKRRGIFVCALGSTRYRKLNSYPLAALDACWPDFVKWWQKHPVHSGAPGTTTVTTIVKVS